MICLTKTKSIERIAQEIIKGNPVILPTETVYGIGVRYDSQFAVDNLFTIKNRSIHKPISLHITKNMLKQFNIANNLQILCDRLFPGPFTIIVESKEQYGFHSDDIYSGKIGIRVPENQIFQQVLEMTNIPLCMTSANLSEQSSGIEFDKIELNNNIVGMNKKYCNQREVKEAKIKERFEIQHEINIPRNKAFHKEIFGVENDGNVYGKESIIIDTTVNPMRGMRI
ncbi:L-threonylcarbamoyladenylate synthase [Candidatus Cytomitobacter primus]|uniref:L-threonylcarbamoyladenylate synthase n=1 Tax=Candidatus Cytomitobacter primus TaxID=2066024 RepID=A0A5C0UIW0_9PROT|nr:Sua5/YciO/YrdC/YwlC family protein [Candidatus Cytomitobacter primus]QEK38814.1 hypothetical protein FZC34_02785 [Candidatus Cytomitobacter primus]